MATIEQIRALMASQMDQSRVVIISQGVSMEAALTELSIESSFMYDKVRFSGFVFIDGGKPEEAQEIVRALRKIDL